MTCGNKEHKLHVCGSCSKWTVDIYFDTEKMTETCKLCMSGDCQFEKSDKNR